jgi:two-component system cell cycle sensor histidine kinase/response regulator CckA
VLGRTLGEESVLALGPEPDLPNVRADRAQIEQVLLNLTLYARDAMPRGGRLTILF